MHCLGKIAFFFRDNFHNIMNNTTVVNYFYLALCVFPLYVLYPYINWFSCNFYQETALTVFYVDKAFLRSVHKTDRNLYFPKSVPDTYTL